MDSISRGSMQNQREDEPPVVIDRGLRYDESLELLYDEINKTLSEFKERRLRPGQIILSFFRKNAAEIVHNFLGIFLCSLSLFISFSENFFPNTSNAIFLLIVSFFNLSIVILVHIQSEKIIYNKAKQLLVLIKNCLSLENKSEWAENNQFLRVDIPNSSSISCHLTYREGRLVNLPMNLIVKGDVILLRPGQIIELNCRSYEKNSTSQDYEYFEVGKTYEPSVNLPAEKQQTQLFFDNLKTHEDIYYKSFDELCEYKQIPKSIVCMALETPYISFLRKVLYNYECDSDSIFVNEFQNIRKIMLFFLIPTVIVIQTCVSCFYYLFFRQSIIEPKFHKTYWTSLSYVVLPLLPVAFTVFWQITSLHGTVALLKIRKCLGQLVTSTNETNSNENRKRRRSERHDETTRSLWMSNRNDISNDMDASNDGSHMNGVGNALLSPSMNRYSDMDNLSSRMNDIPSLQSLFESLAFDDPNAHSHRDSFFVRYWRGIQFYVKIVRAIFFNESLDEDSRNANFIFYSNFLVGLGIITNFSCIDKKGVLSWPNPTPERLWVFSEASPRKNSTADGTNDDKFDEEFEDDTFAAVSSPKVVDERDEQSQNFNETGKSATFKSPVHTEKTHLETFNLTVDNANGFKVKFDDTNWAKSINCLKPLGLTILLNSCNKSVSDNYLSFYDFIQNEIGKLAQSQFGEKHSLANTNTINNNSSSTLSLYEDNFEIKETIDLQCLCEIPNIIGFEQENAIKSYQVLSTSAIYRNLEIKSNCKLRPKQVYLSNLYSVIAKCQLNGLDHIYSQGSPDLILDLCNDCWNGKTVSELSKSQRKKLFDLYQRFSVSSYCTAFSFKPLLKSDLPSGLSDKVLRFPPMYCDKMTNSQNYYEKLDLSGTNDSDSTILDESERQSLQFESRDSAQDVNRSIGHSAGLQDGEIRQALDVNSNQIFLGMVSTQYKAKLDVVKLVEKLTKSCIRFVHFSADNEQISRTFAEMLGLDTGWNCHISLSSRTQTIAGANVSQRLNTQDIVSTEFNETANKTIPLETTLASIMTERERLILVKGKPVREHKFLRFPHTTSSTMANKFKTRIFRTGPASLNNTNSKSLPSLKLKKFNHTGEGVVQMVKFNLVNLGSRKKQYSKQHHTSNNYYKKKKLIKSMNRSSISISSGGSSSSFEQSNTDLMDSSTNQNTISSSMIKQSRLAQMTQQPRQNSAYKTSESSLKSSSISRSIIKIIGSSSFKRKKNLISLKPLSTPQTAAVENDDTASSDTNHSGRTLSETEILGNAARLPRGIENVRRHLDNNIDNVPLHVSLFTDSTKDSIMQMVTIMKDYGEIVCCFGSSHSIQNNFLFSNANVAISIQPLYPKLCWYENSNGVTSKKNKRDEMFDLSVSMNTLSCGINLNQEDICILPPIMSLAREMIHSYRIALVFMLMSSISVTLVQLICNLLFLPPIMSGFQVLSLILFTIPLLSYSLIHKKESNDLRCSTKKKQNLVNRQDIRSFVLKFLVKFCPSIIILVIFHFLSLYFKCKAENEAIIPGGEFNTTVGSLFGNTTIRILKYDCHLFAFDLFHLKEKSFNSYNYWLKNESVQFSQLFNHFFLSIYFVFISLSYVCIEKSIWSYVPFLNKTWTKTVLFVLTAHLGYLFTQLFAIEKYKIYFDSIPIKFWILTILWPILLIILNELYKVFEIKEILRKYKKIRLDFDTKLGMNSPFV